VNPRTPPGDPLQPFGLFKASGPWNLEGLGLPEIAEMLGVSRHRANRIVLDDPTFQRLSGKRREVVFGTADRLSPGRKKWRKQKPWR
jgi:hypothetical protein